MAFRYVLPAAFVLLAAMAGDAAAQTQVDDVVLLGEMHGTRPPEAYFRFKAERPDAFTFNRAWKARNPRLRRLAPAPGEDVPRFQVLPDPRGTGGAGRSDVFGGSGGADAFDGPAAASLGPRDAPVEGTIRVPLVLGRFAESGPAPYDRETVQREFFDGPNSRYGTITEFYREMSGGRVELLGTTTDWVQSELTRVQVAGGVSGLAGSARVGEFILELLDRNRHLDWGQFDNDGPDGVPNSGDDDGYVDVLAVMHPTLGAECEGNDQLQDDLVWSHKWSLQSASGQVFHTDTPASGHGRAVLVDDYTIQSVVACDGSSINQIGVLAHELGHGLGLPDLYDTRGRHNGAGRWDLMASGSWGCSPSGGAERPCHMSAWSKEQLGWVDVVSLDPGQDHGVLTLDPVEDGGAVWRVDVPGREEYFLLENRQRIGFDQDLFETGLLIWHVDEARVLSRWLGNSVNTDGARMGVHLEQADGRNDLGTQRLSGSSNPADDGDPFPGITANRSFHAASLPDARGWDGHPSGLTVLDIEESVSDRRIRARVLTRFQEVSVRTQGGESEVQVDGAAAPGSPPSFLSAPFQEHVVEVGPGPSIADGRRAGFQGWLDDPSLGRSRTFTTGLEDVELVAEYGGVEVRVRGTLEGERSGVTPGVLDYSPAPVAQDDGVWFPEGEVVLVEARAEPGYAFQGWTGGLEGQANPASFQAVEPLDFGAAFHLTYGIPGDVSLSTPAARELGFELVAEGGTEPVRWSVVGGALPRGLELSSSGRISGAALETGSFPVTVQARDARGLEATAQLSLEIEPPLLEADALTAPFLLTAGSLTELERLFLDTSGNENGIYDLGDLRAFLLAHPDLPFRQAEQAVIRGLITTVRFEQGGHR